MGKIAQTLEDVARYGPHRAHVINVKSAGSVPTHFVEIDVAAGSHRFTPHSDFMLGRVLRMTDVGRIENEHGQRPYARSSPGDLELVAPWSNGVYHCDGQTHIVLMSISQRHIDEALEGQESDFKGDFGCLHSGTMRSVSVRHLFDQLWRCCGQNRPFSNLAAEGLRTAIIAQLLNLSQQRTQFAVDFKHRIPADVMRQIDDFVDSVQDAKVYTRDLANIAGMPISTFSRAFCKTTGQTAYQYVIDRRVDLARSLLSQSTDSLAEIALKTGFASQSHMTDVFRRKVGASPGSFRRSRKS